jgi:hypothetical protein
MRYKNGQLIRDPQLYQVIIFQIEELNRVCQECFQPENLECCVICEVETERQRLVTKFYRSLQR